MGQQYLLFVRRFEELSTRNDIRLLFHAVIIARAYEEEPEEALEELERYSKRFTGTRLEVVLEDEEIHLTLGERRKVVPRFTGGDLADTIENEPASVSAD